MSTLDTPAESSLRSSMRNMVPALVVGAGPVGLVMACELLRHGVPCRIIDQASEPSIWSKAQIIHARTLEIFEDLGLASELIARGKLIQGATLCTQGGKPLAQFEISESDTAFPNPLSLSQRETELLLIEHLQKLGVTVEREVTLLDLKQDDEGVTCEMMHRQGQIEKVRATWLLGCDGSHSTVRKRLGLDLPGATYEWRVTQADVRIDWPLPYPEDDILAFLSPDGPMAAFPMAGDRRYRLAIFDSLAEPTLENFQRLLEERGPKGAVVSDPHWMVQFTIHCRMVDRYRVNGVFLAGDAAHIHSPAGGQGMNTGIQDAYNLAWKLGLVHRGLARPSLLDSYDRERRPVAVAVLRGTDGATRSAGILQKLRNTLAQTLRDQVLHLVTSLSLVQRRTSRALSELDVGYPDSPIVGQHRTSAWSARLTRDESSEAPALGDWFAFGSGPAPGTRVPDFRFTPAGGAEQRLHTLLRGGLHTLLLFDGAAATEEGYRNLARIGQDALRRLGDRVKVYVVVPAASQPPSLLWDGELLLDAAGELHQAFSARTECLYLIRPDGYVAFRSQPASQEALGAYLDKHLVEA